ncbi:MAG: S66 peptidase family protein [Thermodesulfobacteriota bacterium]
MSKTSKRLLPPPLAKGDTLGIFAPAGPIVDQDAFANGVKMLKELGFNLRFQRGLETRNHGYLAGHDDERAKEIMDLWRDPEVKGLVAARGGYGCLRLLDLLDFKCIASMPKRLIGFSDLTTLHAAILKQTKQISLHGPMVTTLGKSDPASVDSFVQALTNRLPEAIKPAGLEILRGENATGPLIGGNLTNLAHLVGTPWEPEWQGAVLLLEDVGEAPYRIDRLLHHLKGSGRLGQVTGLILGTFTDCGDEENIWNLALDLTKDRRIPVWANFPSGHGSRNLTLPLGAEVTLDSNKGTLRIAQPDNG